MKQKTDVYDRELFNKVSETDYNRNLNDTLKSRLEEAQKAIVEKD
jgi:hypothetical protein